MSIEDVPDVVDANDPFLALEMEDAYRGMLQFIETLAPEPLSSVLFDWVAGVRGSDTARQRGLSPSTVTRLRHEGFVLLRDWDSGRSAGADRPES